MCTTVAGGPCPNGNYALGNRNPPTCTAGTGPTTCAAGSYLSVPSGSTLASFTFACAPCPSGYQCPGGVGAPATIAAASSFQCASPGRWVPLYSVCAMGLLPMSDPNAPQFYSLRMSCPAGTYGFTGFGCLPCPAGQTCRGYFRLPDPAPSGPAGPSASPTPTSTPTPTPSATPVPPPRQDILVAYQLRSSDVCVSRNSTVATILSPESGMAAALRSSFARTLSYNASSAFISGLLVCGGDYIPVDKTAPVNVVNPDAVLAAAASSAQGPARSLRLRQLQTSTTTPSNQTLASLNLTINGDTVTVELGVQVPQMLAGSLATFLSAVLRNDTAAIQSAAAAITAIMSSPAYLTFFPVNSSAAATGALPPMFSSLIAGAATSPASLPLTDTLDDVLVSAAPQVLAALNLPANTTFSATIVADSIRAGDVTVYAPSYVAPVLPAGGAASAAAGDGSSSGGSGALGALVLIPLAGIVIFFLYRRREKEKKEKEEAGADGMKKKKDAVGVVVDTDVDGPAFAAVNPMGTTATTAGGKHAGGLVVRRQELVVAKGSASSASSDKAGGETREARFVAEPTTTA
jgi:hypothetical protein